MTTIAEHPIPFSGPMVRAILEGKKTQTRRLIRPHGWPAGVHPRDVRPYVISEVQQWHPTQGPMWLALRDLAGPGYKVTSPYGRAGHRLWVREAHALVPSTAYRGSTGVVQTVNPDAPDEAAIYREGWDRAGRGGFRWRPSIHMPRWASRLLLEVVAVRVEPLQAITDADARAEGVTLPERTITLYEGMWRDEFARLWDGINGERAAWASSPWVWVVTFARVQP